MSAAFQKSLVAKHLVRVHTGGRRYHLSLKAGVQQIHVGPDSLSLAEVHWWESRVSELLEKICKENYHDANVDVVVNGN